MLFLVLVWPVFLTAFLLGTRERHEEKSFQQKFSSMYLTNKTDCYVGKQLQRNRSLSFLYTVWFCLRRLAFVLCFFFAYNTWISWF